MCYQGIIFDLDGVICSTDEYHYLAWKAMADEIGAPFDRTVNNRLRGVSRMASLEIILEQYTGPELTQADKEALASRKNELYREYLTRMSRDDLSGEVKHTLAILRDRGYKLAIGSSSKNSPLILERIGLKGYFDAEADGNRISRSKPDPEVFLLAARLLELPPRACLVVEDALSGVDAARAGGMRAAAVGDAAAKQYGDYILSSFAELLTLLPPKR